MVFIGTPTNITVGLGMAPYGGSHRFYAAKNTDFAIQNIGPWSDALNIAFGVLPENEHPNF